MTNAANAAAAILSQSSAKSLRSQTSSGRWALTSSDMEEAEAVIGHWPTNAENAAIIAELITAARALGPVPLSVLTARIP